MSKRIKRIKHLRNTKDSRSSSDNILQAINDGREEIKSLQKSLANHREDDAVNAIVLSGLLKRILERIKYD